METKLSTFTNFYIFPTGRQVFTLRNIVQALAIRRDAALADIAERAAVALERARETLRLEQEFKGVRAGFKERPSVADIDVKVDRATASFRDGIAIHIDPAADDTDEVSKIARRLEHELFPNGVTDIIHRPFPVQLAMLEDLLAKVAAEHMPTIERLGLELPLERLTRLTAEYRNAQDELEGGLDFAEVKESRARAQEMMTEVVVMILGRFPLPTDAHARARESLLGQFVLQNQAIGVSLRSRRGRADDVDPETGETIAAASEPPPTVPLPEVPPVTATPDVARTESSTALEPAAMD